MALANVYAIAIAAYAPPAESPIHSQTSYICSILLCLGMHQPN